MLLVPLLAGCADLMSRAQEPQVQQPQVEERGDCTLDRATERVVHYDPPLRPDTMVELEPPYVVTLKRSIDFPHHAWLMLEGDGWHYPGEVDLPDWPTSTVVAPDGELSVIPNSLTETLHVEYLVDAPGTWTFTVEWDLIDCLQTVSVEVLPPQ